MVLTWKEEQLDLVLVPSGLLIMLAYHLFHLHKCLNFPETTVVGYENHSRKAWVARILQVKPKKRGHAIAVISSNLSAATSLASTSLALTSLIAAWIGNSYHNEYLTAMIYGNRSSTIAYVKYVSILACFMMAFVSFVQTTRCFTHANFLISMPNCEIPVRTIESAVIEGSNFWVVGLRLLYFATNLLLWVFGPIPMFVCSVVTVGLLQYLDRNAAPLPQYGDEPVVRCEEFEKIGEKMSEIDRECQAS